MHFIYNNPYRVIGIYAGASERKLQAQKSKINAFMRAGKELVFDQDFEFLPRLKRELATIDNALSTLQLNQNKLYYSIFWFVMGNHIDETALRHLEEGSPLKAKEIWEKVCFNQDLSSKNVSSNINLSTLQLALALKSNVADENVRYAFLNKFWVLESEYFYDFAHQVTDENYNPEIDEIKMLFVDEVTSFFIEHKKLFYYHRKSIYREVNEVFADSSFTIKEYVKQKMISIPVSGIEREISTTSEKRMEMPSDGLNLSRNLIANIKEDWSEIGSNFKGDYAVQQLSDKIANEVFLCAINCFNEHVDNKQTNKSVESEKRFGNSVLSVLVDSMEFATNEATIQRINSNIDSMQKWIGGAEERVKFQNIEDDIYALERAHRVHFNNKSFEAMLNENFIGLKATIDDFYNYWLAVKGVLRSIEQKMGRYDKLTVEICSGIIAKMTDHIVRLINFNMKTNEHYILAQRIGISREEVIRTIEKSLEIFKEALTYPLDSKSKSYVSENVNTLQKIILQVKPTQRASNNYKNTNTGSGKTTDSDGCLTAPGYVILVIIIIVVVSSIGTCGG
jgi:hypothetical protein